MNKALLISGLLLGLAFTATYAFAGGCGMPGMNCGSCAAAAPVAKAPVADGPPAENQLQIIGTVVSVEPNGAALLDIGTAKVYVVAPQAPNADGTVPPSPFKVGDRLQVAGVLMALSIQPAPGTAQAPPAAAVYICTMCPDVHASKPGNCPKCGMKLVRKQ